MLIPRLKSCLTLLCFLGAALMASSEAVYLKDFLQGVKPGQDAGYALTRALKHCRSTGADKLVLPGGTLFITPAYLPEQYAFVSNNDESLKRIAFNLTGMQGFTIEGNGTSLLFSGFVTPFLMQGASDITVKEVNVDYVRTFHSEGVIEGSGKDYLDIRFTEEYPWTISEGRLKFRDKENNDYPYTNLLEFDPVKRETAFMAKDYWIFSNGSMPAEKLENGNVRIFKENLTGKTGNILVFGAGDRLIPCFIVSDSRKIYIQNVNIYHCGGMGVIAQRSGDITLDHVKVTPSPGKNRIISITADATHFSNCTGTIHMLDCTFENQKDDATNIHGIYAVIDTILSSHEMILQLKHSQQHGFDFLKPGVSLELADAKSLITYGQLKVREAERLNKEYTRIVLEAPLPGTVKVKDVVASTEANPDVVIRNCIMRGNRARGLLIGSRGKVLIENNHFHIAGASILFEGDGTYWYEQSGVRDVIIRNNLFENCNYGVWGKSCIEVGSGIRADREKSRYHQNILVEKNTFRGFDPRLVNIYCVDGFTFRNNLVEKTTDYPYIHEENRPIVTENCDRVVTDVKSGK